MKYRALLICVIFLIQIGVYSQSCNPGGIILSGGPETVAEETTPRIPSWIFELNCPLLGICYGHIGPLCNYNMGI